MNNILIIEDEAIASQHLGRLLRDELQQDVAITVVQTIEESIPLLRDGHFSIVFSDIHLADGLAFRIFDEVDPQCPVIFTTAYDQYALDAFRAGGYDYLLKPIDRDELRRALGKVSALRTPNAALPPLPTVPNYRSHFLIPVRDKLIPIEVKEVAYFYLEEKITRAVMYDGRRQIIDRPLDAIMDELNPHLFFRANRQYIVAHKAIAEIAMWPIGKLVLTLAVPTEGRVVVSKAKVPEFKRWYTK